MYRVFFPTTQHDYLLILTSMKGSDFIQVYNANAHRHTVLKTWIEAISTFVMTTKLGTSYLI